jgi:hypothetical protein
MSERPGISACVTDIIAYAITPWALLPLFLAGLYELGYFMLKKQRK